MQPASLLLDNNNEPINCENASWSLVVCLLTGYMKKKNAIHFKRGKQLNVILKCAACKFGLKTFLILL